MNNEIPCKECISFAICKIVYNKAEEVDILYNRKYSNDIYSLEHEVGARIQSIYERCELFSDWYDDIRERYNRNLEDLDTNIIIFVKRFNPKYEWASNHE